MIYLLDTNTCIFAMRQHARVVARLKARRPIGERDTMIAATALACGLTLVTNNVSEFERVTAPRIEDWTTP